MRTDDEWGRDPQVQYMRRVFAHMEKAQAKLLEAMGISFLDERLPGTRKITLTFFERAWRYAAQKDIDIEEDEFEVLYLHCFARALASRGLNVPAGILRGGEKMERIVKEAVQ